MQFTDMGTWIDESFRFDLGTRQQAIKDFSKESNAQQVELFLTDCEQIIILWLSEQEPRTLASEFRMRLLELEKDAKKLHADLIKMPVDCSDDMEAQSLLFERQLRSFAPSLENDLLLLAEIAGRCLEKQQLKAGRDRGYIKWLVNIIINSYKVHFKKKPSKSKAHPAPLFIFLQGTVANAVGEQIGFDLYIYCVKKGGGLPENS